MDHYLTPYVPDVTPTVPRTDSCEDLFAEPAALALLAKRKAAPPVTPAIGKTAKKRGGKSKAGSRKKPEKRKKNNSDGSDEEDDEDEEDYDLEKEALEEQTEREEEEAAMLGNSTSDENSDTETPEQKQEREIFGNLKVPQCPLSTEPTANVVFFFQSLNQKRLVSTPVNKKQPCPSTSTPALARKKTSRPSIEEHLFAATPARKKASTATTEEEDLLATPSSSFSSFNDSGFTDLNCNDKLDKLATGKKRSSMWSKHVHAFKVFV